MCVCVIEREVRQSNQSGDRTSLPRHASEFEESSLLPPSDRLSKNALSLLLRSIRHFPVFFYASIRSLRLSLSQFLRDGNASSRNIEGLHKVQTPEVLLYFRQLFGTRGLPLILVKLRPTVDRRRDKRRKRRS